MRWRCFPQFAMTCGLVFVSLTVIPSGEAAWAAPIHARHAAVDRTSEKTGYLRLGQAVPDVALTTLNGKSVVSLSAFIRKEKKPLIINAWASWCPPCQKETPGLVRLYKAYARRVGVLGVNLTSIDSIDSARQFVHRYHIPYRILLDTKGAFRFAYTVIAEPMTYVVSRSGKLLAVYIGAMKEAQMNELMRVAISEKPMDRLR